MPVNAALPVVDVGVDPFVLRSALHAALAADGRFEVVLCPSGDDPRDHATMVGADVVLVSRVAPLPGVVVVALLDDPLRLSLTRGGQGHDVPYGGLSTLAQALANAVRPGA